MGDLHPMISRHQLLAWNWDIERHFVAWCFGSCTDFALLAWMVFSWICFDSRNSGRLSAQRGCQQVRWCTFKTSRFLQDFYWLSIHYLCKSTLRSGSEFIIHFQVESSHGFYWASHDFPRSKSGDLWLFRAFQPGEAGTGKYVPLHRDEAHQRSSWAEEVQWIHGKEDRHQIFTTATGSRVWHEINISLHANFKMKLCFILNK